MKNCLKKVLLFLKANITTIIILFLFLFLYVVDSIKTPLTTGIMDNFKVVASSFSPKTGIFTDDSEISYVSYVFNILNPTRDISFVKPTQNPEITKDEYELTYSYSGIVFAASSGIVKSVGFVENEKYIEILHSDGYLTKYMGIETLGVCINETVKQNQAIGVVSSDSKFRFSVFKGGAKYKISEVKWEK